MLFSTFNQIEDYLMEDVSVDANPIFLSTGQGWTHVCTISKTLSPCSWRGQSEETKQKVERRNCNEMSDYVKIYDKCCWQVL